VILAAVVLLESITIGILIGHITNGSTRAAGSRAPVRRASTAAPGAITADSPLSPSAGQVFFVSHFTAADGWTVGRITAHATGRLVRGGYQITGSGFLQHGVRAPVAAFRSISVTETNAIPPAQDGAGPQCVSGSGPEPDIFQLDLHGDGEWWLEERSGSGSSGRPATTLDAGEVGGLAGPPSGEIVCVTLSLRGGTADMRLAAFVDGTKVADVTTAVEGVELSGWQAGLFFGTDGEPASLTFTSFVARRLDS
jgi:hypothetical protein